MSRQPRHTRGAIWNMTRGRDPGMAVAGALQLAHDHDLEWLLLTESTDYIRKLGKLAGWRLVAFDLDRGQADTAILVRHSAELHGSWAARMTFKGWVTIRGGKTPPKYLVTTKLNGWLRLGALHYPPSCRWTEGGQLRGPVARVASIVVHAHREVRFARRRPQGLALLIGGDRNAHPTDRGRWSPQWIADQAGLEVAAPATATHRNGVIDFALTRGVDVTAKTVEKYGSTHHAVVLSVIEEG